MIMYKYATILFVLSIVALHSLGCGGKSDKVVAEQPSNINIVEVAKTVSKGVGSVGRCLENKNATPIVIFEENHASRQGQIQQAITIERLRKNYGIKHIALEGYLKDRDKIKTEWYDLAANGNVNSKIRVAINFLQEGEISCAEFMKLIYKEIIIHPIEVEKDYAFELSEEASAAPILYLMKIAEKSLSKNEIREINTMQEAMEGMPEREELNGKIQEMIDYILKSDPWVYEKSKMLRDVDTQLAMSTQEMVKAYEEINDRGRALATSKERKAMERHLDFSRGRAAADLTMSEAASEVANRDDAKLIAMIIGALHTDPVCDNFEEWGRPFAVFTPLSLINKDKRGDLPYEMYEKKYNKLPVHSEGFSKLLLDAFGKKPEPVLNQKWFQANAEIRLFTDQIAQRILGGNIDGGNIGPPTTPFENMRSPYGFSKDDLSGKWISIDSMQIEVVDDDSSSKNKDKQKAVLFPVQFKNGGMIWIKAAINQELAFSINDKYDVEELLLRSLEEVQKIDLSHKVEGRTGRIRFSLNTVATFGMTKQAAKNVRLIS